MSFHDSRTIANWFIQRAKRDRSRTLTNMQLQKLVYFAHGWAMALHRDPLVKDEVQAWEFGPVIPNLYQALSTWGAEPVTRAIVGAPEEYLEPYEEEVLEQVYQAYGKYPAATLSALTHQQGSPWARAFEPGRRGVVIDNNVIADHFSELASRRAS